MDKIKIIILLLCFGFPVFLKAQNAEVVIKGIVIDKKSHTPLPDANVWLSQAKVGTISDSIGGFRIQTSHRGPDTLCVQYMGYYCFRHPVLLKNNLPFFTVELKRKILLLPEINVSQYRYLDDWRISNIEPTPIKIKSKELRSIPISLVPDLYRFLQTFPGISTSNEISNKLCIRGGSPDQNLVLLDGVPVYYPFHIFGLATAFNQDMVNRITVSKGGFSAKYGDRLSAVLNIRTIQPEKKINISSNINLLSSDITIGGRIDSKVYWLLSGRRSYYDVFMKKVPYYFYDIFSKFTVKPNRHNLFTVSMFLFNDLYDDRKKHPAQLTSSVNPQKKIQYYDVTHNNYGWGNRITQFTWNWEWYHNLISQIQAYQSTSKNHYAVYYTYEFSKNMPQEFNQAKEDVVNNDPRTEYRVNNFLSNHTLKLCMSYYPAKQIQLEAGIAYSDYSTDYGWQNSNSKLIRKFYNDVALYFDYAPSGAFDYKKTFHKKSSFIELFKEFPNVGNLRLGVRFTKWNFHKKINIEPRLNFSWQISDEYTCKLAYGRFSQGLATSLEDGSIGFLELYFPVDCGENVEIADHYIFSLEYESSKNTRFSLSPYLKDYSGLLRSIGPDPTFIQTPGKSWGVELSFLKRFENLDFRVNAELSRTQRTVDQLTYDLKNDHRFRFQIIANRTFGEHWRLNSLWVFHTGRPYTPYEYISFERTASWERSLDDLTENRYRFITIDSPRGRVRYPYYHRLDISLFYSTKYKNWSIEPYISIRNIYNRENVLYYKSFFPEIYSNGELLLLGNDIDREYKYIPILPAIGVQLKF